ncbi:MAG TPA: spore coat protein U domain-containing protein [Usitatibacter sp.]|jgi:spore coat protein U-like protein|nr:spore coat protein U domain-containing protein [Usitatibacter sp.]
MNKVAKAVALVSFLGAATLANAGTVGPQNFNVTVNLTSSCSLTSAPTDVAFTYTSFGPAAVATPSSFTVKCTNLRPYTMALDAAAGTVIGLAYTLALPTAASTGTGVDQTFSITGNMIAGQSGNCAGASCAGTDVRTLTITY